jgi:WD40 repeat protein
MVRPYALALIAALLASAAGAAVTMVGRGVISTSADEFGGQFTRDGKTLYFDRSIPRSVLYVICVSHLVHGEWTKPQVAPFSGQYRDSDPVLSADGQHLYFASDRPWPGQKEPNYDIWSVALTGPDANVPHRLEGGVNTDANEFFASDTDDGTMYVASDREGSIGYSDIYRVPREGDRYGTAVNLGQPVNTAGVFTVEALVAHDGAFMVIGCFGHPGGKGDSDLFVARSIDGRWMEPQPLNAINTTAREYSPRFSPDGKHLIFASERGLPNDESARPITYDELLRRAADVENGLGNIDSVPFEEIGLP